VVRAALVERAFVVWLRTDLYRDVASPVVDIDGSSQKDIAGAVLELIQD
jgi:hypothetical protein